MHVFLTGGTGFIGSYVAVELVNRGHQVTNLARNPNKVKALRHMPQIEMVEGDLTDRPLLERLIKGKDACIHVALNYTSQSGWQVLLDDTLPTVFLSDVAAQAGVKHFIYTSSTATNDSLYMGGADEAEDSAKVVTPSTKPHPATFYGATKSASEMYLLAQSHRSTMRINIIRPGYTYGNPVVEGADTEGDSRFRDIVATALEDESISVVKNDGTQFIWAGDLAKLYGDVLESDVNRRTYFGLSQNFVSWHTIAQESIKRCDSSSPIRVEDRDWSDEGLYWDVTDMKRDFGLEFDAWDHIGEHLDYYIHKLQAG